MRRLFLFLLLLVASVWIGIIVVRHPGYLFLVYQPWMVQMPLWFALITLVVSFAVFYILIDSIDRLQFWWFRLKNWLHFRKERKSYSKTQYGLALLIEGRFKKAERLLLEGVNQTVDPLINYLGAAQAAHAQGAYARRDRYLQSAYNVAPHATMAIGITTANLQMDEHQFELAIATLRRLQIESPRHPRVLSLLEKAYVHTADWHALLRLLPSLRKANILTSQQYAQFEKNLYVQLLSNVHPTSLQMLHAEWDQLPRAIKKDPDVVCAYVKQLAMFGAEAEREELIRKTLKSHWQPELVRIYSTLPFANLNRQLVIGGAWLKLYGPQPELLLLLGKLCVRVQLWGKAKDYFERCLALKPDPEAALEYGRLLEQLGETDLALQKYKLVLTDLASPLTLPDNRRLALDSAEFRGKSVFFQQNTLT